MPRYARGSMADRAATRTTRAAETATRRKTRDGARPRQSRWPVPPVLVRHVRNGVVESVHRGDVVEVDAQGRMLRVLGDPDRVVYLRSTVKPHGLVSLLRAGAQQEFDLTPDELAVMASSHSGEDLHVRTIQALFRRLGIPQTLLACGAEEAPLDPLTAARLARDGERPSPLRHMCSGQHSALILLAKLGGWELETYWQADHPAHVAYRDGVADAYNVPASSIHTGIDGCGVLTYAFPLREIARAYAILADPEALPADDPRSALARPLIAIRDAMLAYPELIGGTRDRLDTSLMKAAEGRVVSKSGMEALRGIGIMRGPRGNGGEVAASGIAIKIEDGDGHERATWAASVEAVRQAGVLDGQPLRVLARYHRPQVLDPHGRTGAESIPSFDLAPVGELIG